MKQAIINKLREFFTLQPVEKAWVFGSYSRGEESRESDIDILVRFDKNANVTLFKYIGIVNALHDSDRTSESDAIKRRYRASDPAVCIQYTAAGGCDICESIRPCI